MILNVLRVFGNRVLRGIFGPKRQKVAEGWRKIRNEGLSFVSVCVCVLFNDAANVETIASPYFYTSPNIIRMNQRR
jgi:hypothetical protein